MEDIVKTAKSIFSDVGRNFIDSLKTDNYIQALDTVDDLEGLSSEEFEKIVSERISVLDEYEKTAIMQVINKKKARWDEEKEIGLSLREEILLEIQSMISSHNYKK